MNQKIYKKMGKMDYPEFLDSSVSSEFQFLFGIK